MDHQAQSNFQGSPAEFSHHKSWRQKEEPGVCQPLTHVVFNAQGQCPLVNTAPSALGTTLNANHLS